MPDEKPTHENIEKYLGELPRTILDRLPDTPRRTAAKASVAHAEQLAHELLEGTERAERANDGR